MQQTDILIIGSGIAGLTYAVKMAGQFPDKKITILTKADTNETNTKYAQGGIAVVNDLKHDSFEKHIKDTLIAGDGLCNKKIVEMVVKEGPARVAELINWGAHFDKANDGDFLRGKEGGHSESRILHHKDITGWEVERSLVAAAKKMKNITFIQHCFVVDIITQHHLGYLVNKSTPDIICLGVYVLNHTNNKIEKILASITLFATGGNGQVYRTTTNPAVATGDGVAMVYRAKGRVENMEFIQFHPTALYIAGARGQAFLLTEALRGDGGILRNMHDEAFMEKYDERKDLAPRDIVARAIDHEMKINGTEHVWLDCRHFPEKKFTEHFPNIYQKCLSIGIDMSKQMIPVSPAAHYSCGGIKTDEWGRSSIAHLYACGECSSTGLHGANRLASNSLLEAMVFAHRCFLDSTKLLSRKEGTVKNINEENKETGFIWRQNKTINNKDIPDWNAKGTSHPKEMILITQSLKELQLLMSDYVGIVRNNIRLHRAMRRLDLLWEETENLYHSSTLSPQLLELRNMITVGYLIVKGAGFRKESRGLHYNTDYPEKSKLVQNIVL